MMHAKTAVADGRWVRVGSTNLNMASWATNWELDIAIEDAGIAEAMEAMYLEDLANATEIVPGSRHPPSRQSQNMRSRRLGSRLKRGGVRRLAAGALALSNSVGRTMRSRSLTATEASSIAVIGGARRGVGHRPDPGPGPARGPRRHRPCAGSGVALLIRSFRLKRQSSASPPQAQAAA